MLCVLLAAGEGKRMAPLTATRPKVMLPVANRPMIEHLICAVRDAGIDSFILVVGYREKEIRDYFGNGEKWGVSIRYTVQRSQTGTGDALRAAKGLVKGRFLLMNGDMIVTTGDIRRICASPAPAVGVVESGNPEQYGVITETGGIVTGIYEKSTNPPGNLINAGMYLFDDDIFNETDRLVPSPRGEYELTDALIPAISRSELHAVPLESWCDIGAPWNLLEANEDALSGIATDIRGDVEDGVTLKGAVVLAEGSVIRSGTYIEGPCMIGSGCTIGPHVYIRGHTVIGDDCHIGHASELKNSVIFPRTKIPHFTYIGDSVVGSGCNFGAGTKVANLRHDKEPVKIGGVSTGRKKFGAVIGDNVLFGINCSINVGASVGRDVRVGPHTVVSGTIADESVLGRN
ncbi:NTP transferase domain-containing protein [Methanogenium sp. S4BF]|uniref:bifunctional sugar-1-phosphate nucleotidylyltransferase/acetyltransferase n=1 Tax=Methanogenium sp. S4BF TaxID=1789226 RepID=UPI002415B311|nr:bifunctional sugar-1-phosphate nucleotidylyltransferase/acetyltransferase [Methanogenium sp. S4BF]WFN34362.1 NTP transferase domain-containing protein [Methanogenium sp. S4BF]